MNSYKVISHVIIACFFGYREQAYVIQCNYHFPVNRAHQEGRAAVVERMDATPPSYHGKLKLRDRYDSSSASLRYYCAMTFNISKSSIDPSLGSGVWERD